MHTGGTLRLSIGIGIGIGVGIPIIQVAQAVRWLMTLSLINIRVLCQQLSLSILPSILIILIVYLLSAVNVHIPSLLKSI
jgi:hypothetical protein